MASKAKNRKYAKKLSLGMKLRNQENDMDTLNSIDLTHNYTPTGQLARSYKPGTKAYAARTSVLAIPHSANGMPEGEWVNRGHSRQWAPRNKEAIRRAHTFGNSLKTKGYTVQPGSGFNSREEWENFAIGEMHVDPDYVMDTNPEDYRMKSNFKDK